MYRGLSSGLTSLALYVHGHGPKARNERYRYRTCVIAAHTFDRLVVGYNNIRTCHEPKKSIKHGIFKIVVL